MIQLFRGLSLSALLLASSMSYAGVQDFSLVNATGYTINEVYVSANNDKNWGEDVMGSDALANGDMVNISFSSKGKDSSICKWDLMVIYDDGEKPVWEDLNLCDISKITLKWDGKNTRAQTE